MRSGPFKAMKRATSFQFRSARFSAGTETSQDWCALFIVPRSCEIQLERQEAFFLNVAAFLIEDLKQSVTGKLATGLVPVFFFWYDPVTDRTVLVDGRLGEHEYAVTDGRYRFSSALAGRQVLVYYRTSEPFSRTPASVSDKRWLTEIGVRPW